MCRWLFISLFTVSPSQNNDDYCNTNFGKWIFMARNCWMIRNPGLNFLWFDLVCLGCVLWHINHYRLFNAKSCLSIYIEYIWFGLVDFYGKFLSLFWGGWLIGSLDFMVYQPLIVILCQILFIRIAQSAGAVEYTDCISAEG